eukprot:scaffold6247_cov416-Prasinococcus_capsulatus_cf.AAC.5
MAHKTVNSYVKGSYETPHTRQEASATRSMALNGVIPKHPRCVRAMPRAPRLPRALCMPMPPDLFSASALVTGNVGATPKIF